MALANSSESPCSFGKRALAVPDAIRLSSIA